MIFEGFEGPFSQSKSIKNRCQVELAMKCASRRPQDNPKTRLRRPKIPKTDPRRAQDAPRTPPGRPKTPPRNGEFRAQQRIFSGPRPQTLPRRPKTPKTASRRPQDGSKTCPRRPQDAPRTPKDAPRRPPASGHGGGNAALPR